MRAYAKSVAGKKSWEPEWLQKIHVPAPVVLIIAIIFILRIPSFFEPYYYGDEMIYLNLGEAVKKGMVLYRDIHDNKPPLLYLTAAIAGNVFWFRAILAGWMIITTIFFWKLASALFPKNKKVVYVSVLTFALLTTIPLLEGQIANAELFMVGPTIIAFYILLTKKLTAKNLMFSGSLIAVSTLFKMPAFFDVGAIVCLWLISTSLNTQDVRVFVRKSGLLLVGFVAPIAFTFLWYWLRGGLSEYVVAAFLQNVGYVSSWRAGGEEVPFLAKNLPLITRGLVVISGIGILYYFRKKISLQFTFVTAWILFSLFAATLSERPYPHYLIQVVPSAAFLVGILAASKSKEQALSIIPLFILGTAVVYFQFWYYPSFSYYSNFINFATGATTKEEYFDGFSGQVNTNYKIASFIRSSSRESDHIFVWGDSPAIYALSKRLPPIKYVATYHINDFSSQEETVDGLSQKPPKLMVILPGADSFPLLNSFLKNSYMQIENIDGAQIWRQMGIPGDILLK